MSSLIKYNGLTTDANTDPLAIFNDSSGSEKLRIINAGYLGINTSSPALRLHIADSTADFEAMRLENTRAYSTANKIYLEYTLNTDSAVRDAVYLRGSFSNITDASRVGLLEIQTCNSGSPATVLAVNGNKVGINTITPGASLDVRGDAIFNEDGGDKDFRIEGDTEVNLLCIDASTDRIGIATNAPASLLDVRGQVSANVGSASSPAYSFVSDLNTGMYSPSA
ncbi:MAG: hypothetical protein AAB834_07105, partial [Patescibacteria group bacterium]